MREVALWRSPVGIVLALLVIAYAGALVVAPIWAIVDGTFKDGVEPVREALKDEAVVHAVQLSFQLAIAATLINTVFGLVIAWVLARHDFFGKRILDMLVDIPFVFAPVVLGYSMIALFGNNGWIDPPFAIVYAIPGMLLGKIFVSLPFVTRETLPILSSMSQEQEQAAYTLGASRWRTFLRVVLPVIWVGVLYGVVLTFARAVGEYGAVAVLSSNIEGKTETATTFIYRAFLDRNRIGAYSVSLLLGGLALGILLLMSALKWAWSRQQEILNRVNSTD